ncbi:MAG: hypothetical protein QOD39_5326 [Mycobacterium sp.]|jgi:hypothetical protein|nr:hypothetical protein [Mycobacterium sp.]
MNKLWIVVALLGIALAGCQFSQKADADPSEFILNQIFTLGGGQEAVIRGQNLSLRFTEVLEDSRCPKQVECFWTGQARISIVVESGKGQTTVSFNTNPAPGLNQQTADVGDYAIVLESLDPYPETPDGGIALQDYRAMLLVRKRTDRPADAQQRARADIGFDGVAWVPWHLK